MLRQACRLLWLKPEVIPHAHRGAINNPVPSSSWKCSQLGLQHHLFADALTAPTESRPGDKKGKSTNTLASSGALATGFTSVSASGDVVVTGVHGPSEMTVFVLNFPPNLPRKDVVQRATAFAWNHLAHTLAALDPKRVVRGAPPDAPPPQPHPTDHCGSWSGYRSAALTGRHDEGSAWTPTGPVVKARDGRVGGNIDTEAYDISLMRQSAVPGLTSGGVEHGVRVDSDGVDNAPRLRSWTHARTSFGGDRGPIGTGGPGKVESALEKGVVQWVVETPADVAFLKTAGPPATAGGGGGDSEGRPFPGALLPPFVHADGAVDDQVPPLSSVYGRVIAHSHGCVEGAPSVVAVGGDLMPSYRLISGVDTPKGVKGGSLSRPACTVHYGTACACFLKFVEDDVVPVFAIQPSFAELNGLE